MTQAHHAADQIRHEWLAADTALARIGKAVGIYGSARIPENHPDYTFAQHTAQALARQGYAVISGGGPGIMQAANHGAVSGSGASIGLNIILPHEQQPNPYQTLSVSFRHFAARKAAFIRHSCAFVAFAGGFGTLDELFETVVLIQTGKTAPRPIVLAGRSFWQGLAAWMEEQLLQRCLIHAADMQLFTFADSVEEITAAIAQAA